MSVLFDRVIASSHPYSDRTSLPGRSRCRFAEDRGFPGGAGLFHRVHLRSMIEPALLGYFEASLEPVSRHGLEMAAMATMADT